MLPLVVVIANKLLGLVSMISVSQFLHIQVYNIKPGSGRVRLVSVRLLIHEKAITHLISGLEYLMCTAIKALQSGCSMHEKPWEPQC